MESELKSKPNITFKKDKNNNILSFFENGYLISEIHYGEDDINKHIIYRKDFFENNKKIVYKDYKNEIKHKEEEMKTFNKIKKILEKIDFFDLYNKVF